VRIVIDSFLLFLTRLIRSDWMNRREKANLKKQIDEMLSTLGRSFRGIELTCRICGDVAFALNPEIAKTFGWSALKRTRGPHFRGVCITCGSRRDHRETNRTV
jgi:hypothetical protein